MEMRKPFLSIPCENNGILTLFGIAGQTATLVVSNLQTLGWKEFEEEMKREFAFGSCIVTFPLYGQRSITAMFQHNFKGRRVRHKKSFLKSIRNRLHNVLGLAEERAAAKMDADQSEFFRRCAPFVGAK